MCQRSRKILQARTPAMAVNKNTLHTTSLMVIVGVGVLTNHGIYYRAILNREKRIKVASQ